MSDELFSGRVGFIGCGAMARALAGGLAAAGIAPERIAGADPDEAQREAFAAISGGRSLADNAALVAESDLVVLAVKPGLVSGVLSQLAGTKDLERPLWISIAAGIRIGTIASALPGGARIIRTMPNTPALARHGATALCGNSEASDADLANAEALFQTVGITWRAPEEASLDAVTALSGSGAAYVFLFLEALEDAGTELGLPRKVAEELALQTVYGAATLLREQDESPATLRAHVTSPGGTTQAAIERLEADGFRELVARALKAARERSIELSREP